MVSGVRTYLEAGAVQLAHHLPVHWMSVVIYEDATLKEMTSVCVVAFDEVRRQKEAGTRSEFVQHGRNEIVVIAVSIIKGKGNRATIQSLVASREFHSLSESHEFKSVAKHRKRTAKAGYVSL